MIGVKERDHHLNGIYSKAAVLWTALPRDCPDKVGVNCGTIEITLSRVLLNFFEIKSEPQRPRLLSIVVEDLGTDDEQRVSKLSVAIDNTRAVFTARSSDLGNDNGNLPVRSRQLMVEREFPDGTGDREFIRGSGLFLAAFNEIVAINWKNIQPTDRDLLCRSCPAQIDRLPRPVD